jgi:hypothetical protein
MAVLMFVFRPLRRWERLLAVALLVFGIGWFVWSL